MTTPPLLIVGLGNPGHKYDHTRHNLGFMVLDKWLKELGTSVAWKYEPSPKSLLAKLSLPLGRTDLLLKPQTFMNDSGQSVTEVLHYFKIAPTQLLVIHDDLDLPLGTLRASDHATAGGHQGVQSIMDALGTSAWLRLRLGINRPAGEQPPEDYVLESFNLEEQTVCEKVLTAASNFISLYRESADDKQPELRNQTFRI